MPCSFPSRYAPANSFPVKEQSSSKACTALHLLPPVLSVAINVVGIIAALIYKNPFLTIPPGVGVLVSGHSLSLAVERQHLKTFQESNAKLSMQVASLTKENEKFQANNEQLKKTSDELEGHLTKAKEDHESLLEAHRETLKKQEEAHQRQLEEIHQLFTAQLESLKTLDSSLEDNVDKLEQKIDSLDALQQAQKEFGSLLETLKEHFFDDRYIKERKTHVEALRAETAELKATIRAQQALEGEKAANVERLKTQVTALEEQIIVMRDVLASYRAQQALEKEQAANLKLLKTQVTALEEQIIVMKKILASDQKNAVNIERLKEQVTALEEQITLMRDVLEPYKKNSSQQN